MRGQPETGFPTKTLILGIVDAGAHSPLHRHNCEEAYYVLQARGEIESDGQRQPVDAGDAVYNRENSVHRVWNIGAETIRLCVGGGIMLVGLVPTWPTSSLYEILGQCSSSPLEPLPCKSTHSSRRDCASSPPDTTSLIRLCCTSSWRRR